jgi:hypothetical protein
VEQSGSDVVRQAQHDGWLQVAVAAVAQQDLVIQCFAQCALQYSNGLSVKLKATNEPYRPRQTPTTVLLTTPQQPHTHVRQPAQQQQCPMRGYTRQHNKGRLRYLPSHVPDRSTPSQAAAPSQTHCGWQQMQAQLAAGAAAAAADCRHRSLLQQQLLLTLHLQ